MSSIGARLTCEVCGAEALVIKAGQGQIQCCDRAMTSSTSSNAQ
jgi:Desulfoferrodoxin, N-terminal domain